MGAQPLSGLELAVLVSVARLGDEAYGLGVRRDVSRMRRHDYSVGAIYTTLARLEEKGLVTSTSTDPDGTITDIRWDTDNDGSFDDGSDVEASRICVESRPTSKYRFSATSRASW